MMVDVNFLNRMNDTHGHEKGNEYLKNAANLLASVCGSERVYRTGGDEFVVVLDKEAQQGMKELIGAFKAAVAV